MSESRTEWPLTPLFRHQVSENLALISSLLCQQRSYANLVDAYSGPSQFAGRFFNANGATDCSTNQIPSYCHTQVLQIIRKPLESPPSRLQCPETKLYLLKYSNRAYPVSPRASAA